MSKKLWNLTKDSLHVKFFKWMWGIYAPTYYKTACPYYWQYIGSIIILPFIILIKLVTPIAKLIETYIDAMDQRSAEKHIALILEKINNAKTDEEYYNLYLSKYYKKYRWVLANSYKITNKIFNSYRTYLVQLQNKKRKRSLKIQTKIDKVIYGKVGIILACLIVLLFLYLSGSVLYIFLHLFTWDEFTHFMKYVVIFILIAILSVGIGYGIGTVSINFLPNSWFHKAIIVIWKYIKMFSTVIWRIIQMTVSMIKSLYNKSCPTIIWK